MQDEVKPKRHYNASRRRAQAEETKHAIIAAARELFVERGYAGTTIEAIAQRAGVAVETVYATFRTKRTVLVRAMDVAIVGDEAPVPLLEREGPQALLRTDDQREQIRMFADGIREILERAGPMFEVVRSAAPGEPEIAALLQDYRDTRRAGMEYFVRALLANGPLRRALSIDEATDTVWTITSPEVHQLLTVGRGWSGDRYARWLDQTIGLLLLPFPGEVDEWSSAESH